MKKQCFYRNKSFFIFKEFLGTYFYSQKSNCIKIKKNQLFLRVLYIKRRRIARSTEYIEVYTKFLFRKVAKTRKRDFMTYVSYVRYVRFHCFESKVTHNLIIFKAVKKSAFYELSFKRYRFFAKKSRL